MKEFDINKASKRFIIVALILSAYTSIMAGLDAVYEAALNSLPVIDETIDAKAILNMEDLGFEYHKTTDSNISKTDPRLDKNGYHFSLSVENDDINNMAYIVADFYRFSSIDLTNKLYEINLANMYNSYRENFLKNPFETQLKNMDINYEKAIEIMFELDKDEWKADRVYSLHNLSERNLHQIMLQKDKCILILRISSNVNILEHVDVFAGLTEKMNTLLDEYSKE